MKPNTIQTGVLLERTDIMRLFEHARTAEEAGTMPEGDAYFGGTRYDIRQLIGRQEALLNEAECKQLSHLVIDAISGYRRLQEEILIDNATNMAHDESTDMAEIGFGIRAEELWVQEIDARSFQAEIGLNLQQSTAQHSL